MAPLVASDIYPAVRAFLEENELAKSVKAFDKDTTAEEPVKAKKAKALASLTLVAATQQWFDAQAPAKPQTIEAADVYPVLQRFLTEASLAKSLKAFDKETASEEEQSKAARKKAKVLAALELTAACQLWLSGQGEAAAEEKPAKKAKRKAAEVEEEEEEAAAEEEPPKKKGKKEEKNKTKTPGVPFQRIDHDKWSAAIKDNRMRDNTHAAKQKFGGDGGDTWGDKAAEDMLKVKGKGFRKEMAKKKRASWRGGGEINQGVNSIAFSDSDDE